MIDTLSDTVHVARKSYPCDACAVWLNTGYDQSDVFPDDWLIIKAAKADEWKIRKDTKYRKIVSVDNGEFLTCRLRLDMDELCTRLNLYGD